jgi:putative SOS response-associated peptidase YedK
MQKYLDFNNQFLGCANETALPCLEALKTYFPIDKAACEVTSNLKAVPSQEILAIVQDAGENWLVKLHWGLFPFGAQDVSIGDKSENRSKPSLSARRTKNQVGRNSQSKSKR